MIDPPRPSARGVVAGIDGGGTHTRATIAIDGTIRGIGNGPASNYQAVGIAAAGEAIARALDEAWRDAGTDPRRLDTIFLGMAGVISETDRAIIRDEVRRRIAPGAIGIDHDLRSALKGGAPAEPAVVVIVGTGSAAYGRRDGMSWRSGGWGHLLDDVGSGYWLALRGLVAATRAIDGRGPATSLVETLLSTFGIAAPELILHYIHNVLSRGDIAAAAPLVLEAAGNGDEAAMAIAGRGAEELGVMVGAVCRKLELAGTATPVVGTGGVIRDARYRAMIAAEIERHAPSARLVPPLFPPSHAPLVGALLCALELAAGEEYPLDIPHLLADARFASLAPERPDPWA